jgi:hypothetical protein
MHHNLEYCKDHDISKIEHKLRMRAAGLDNKNDDPFIKRCEALTFNLCYELNSLEKVEGIIRTMDGGDILEMKKHLIKTFKGLDDVLIRIKNLHKRMEENKNG